MGVTLVDSDSQVSCSTNKGLHFHVDSQFVCSSLSNNIFFLAVDFTF